MNIGSNNNNDDDDNYNNGVRNENAFNVWKIKIQSSPRFEYVFDLATDRQRCTPDEVKNNSLWSKYMFPKPFAPTTLKSYKSRLIKIVYCLIDDVHLHDTSYSMDKEFDSIENQTPLIDPEELCKRMLELRSVTKETLQLTINFYTNTMNLADYKIPRMVMLPRDKELKNIKEKEKNFMLKKVIDTILSFINDKIKMLNSDYVHDRGLIRGAIVFCIMLGTGMRINEARQLSVDDLNVLIKKGKLRSDTINLKRKRSRNNTLNNIKMKPLELARVIYSRNPTILQISKNTSTPFKDFRRLLEESGVEMERPRSNMIRHYLSSNLYNSGVPLQKVAKLMNHESSASTRHYLNKYNIDLSSDDDDDDDKKENVEKQRRQRQRVSERVYNSSVKNNNGGGGNSGDSVEDRVERFDINNNNGNGSDDDDDDNDAAVITHSDRILSGVASSLSPPSSSSASSSLSMYYRSD
ncbi:vlf-1 [Catopsilia pomona nucleopolyhedrovirus]|uniref:Vlf-1 n=1 Tax=Catopsilia pomona nucleopolyhedrovirus TaxID=1850906 RepID=A0A172WZE2_9ABAC|nr:vlf-1 [Catopsilia pomona nucleopolyhedrovirus]ANF29713.1 vlf-1 [Catopsilia pomona nucleopolyhedrovirus]